MATPRFPHLSACLLGLLFGVIACDGATEQGHTDYKTPAGQPELAQPVDTPAVSPAVERNREVDDEVDDGEDQDVVSNWVVWPGEHANWVRFEGGVTTLTRRDVETNAKTLVCNKPGASIDGASAHVEGRWKYAIIEGIGRITVRYFVGDQPLKEDGHRKYTDLSIGRDVVEDWQTIDRWVEIPEGADNLRYCVELKGSDAVVTTDDLRISEWK